MKKRLLSMSLALLMTVSLVMVSFTGCTSAKKEYVILDENFGGEEYGVGFRNEDIALGLEVQKMIDEMVADGTAKELSTKWFGGDTIIADAQFIEEDTALDGDNSLQYIKDKGELIMGLDDSFPPMGYRDENGDIVGYDIDLATEVCKRMGVKLKLQPIDWDSKELELSSKKIDCIWNGMSITDERVEAMFFAKPYIKNNQIIIVESKSNVKTIADLEGKVIGLQKGSSSLDAVMKNPINEKFKEITQYPQNIDVYNDLKAGRIDVMVVDEVVGKYIVSTDKK